MIILISGIMTGEYVITGRIRDKDNNPVEGYIVEAYDNDPDPFGLNDDLLGTTMSDENGNFRINFGKDDFKRGSEWLDGNPEVYLNIKDEDDWVVVKTKDKENKTQSMEFQIKLGKVAGNRSEPDLYIDSFVRIIAGLRTTGDAIDLSKGDVRLMFDLFMRVLRGWTVNRDEILALSGYDGIQVPKRPREQKHYHVIRWDKPSLKN